MAPVLDFPDARFDAFRRTDRYGPLGHKPQPAVEYVRLSLAAVTLVPVKMALTLAVIVTHYVVCRLAWLVPARGGTRDRVLAAAGAVAARCALSTLGFTSVTRVPLAYAPGTGPTADAGAGHHANGGVNGENGDTTASHSPPLPGAVVSNHVGYCDILVHMAGGVSSFVARGATKDVPLVGVISQTLNCIFVDRGKAASAAGAADAVRDRIAAAAAGAARPLLVFPEGTTTNGRFLLPFRKGAFLAGAPVRPCILSYKRTRVNPSWETISAPRHIFYMLAQPTHAVTVYDLPVWTPNTEEAADPALYASRVRRAMLAAGDFSPLDASLADKWEYHALLRGKTAEEAAAARVGKVKAA